MSKLNNDQKIFYLETDLGQPTFGLPSFVSLYYFTNKDFQLTNSHNKIDKEPIV